MAGEIDPVRIAHRLHKRGHGTCGFVIEPKMVATAFPCIDIDCPVSTRGSASDGDDHELICSKDEIDETLKLDNLDEDIAHLLKHRDEVDSQPLRDQLPQGEAWKKFVTVMPRDFVRGNIKIGKFAEAGKEVRFQRCPC